MNIPKASKWNLHENALQSLDSAIAKFPNDRGLCCEATLEPRDRQRNFHGYFGRVIRHQKRICSHEPRGTKVHHGLHDAFWS